MSFKHWPFILFLVSFNSNVILKFRVGGTWEIVEGQYIIVNIGSLNSPFWTKQGCSHTFDVGGVQASKIILGPLCLKYRLEGGRGGKLYFYCSLSQILGGPGTLAHSKTTPLQSVGTVLGKYYFRWQWILTFQIQHLDKIIKNLNVDTKLKIEILDRLKYSLISKYGGWLGPDMHQKYYYRKWFLRVDKLTKNK